MKRWFGWLLGAALLFGTLPAAAQYYSWGSDAPMRWSTARLDGLQAIFPDTAAFAGRSILFYADRIRNDIGYGFTHGPQAMPFVLHPENFEANGMVIYLPKRVEMRTIPAAESYAVPWLKQLTAHEFRHTVQYNNLNRGVFRALRVVAGEQSSIASLLCMPFWALEGDAVLSETQMATFGRGLQPSFTIGYRAMERVGTDRTGERYLRNPDKWFCGSFRDCIPDHYHLGYQLNAYAYDRYGENVWNRVTALAVRRPYYLATTRIGFKKYYGTTVNRLFRETFDQLQAHWDSLPQRPDSARPLVELPDGNYTTYRWPLPLDDGTLVVVKEDFDRPSLLVLLDPRTGEERLVAHTGLLSSRPALQGRRIWWTEYSPSKLFEERVNSQLCYLDLDEGRPRRVDGRRNVLYPTPMGEQLAWVEHTPDGRYAVADDRGIRMPLPFGTELHGLAWDSSGNALFGLTTDDAGMRIVRIDRTGLHPVTPATYATLSDLRSGNDGALYFGSIASGKDEVYRLDLLAQAPVPQRLSTARYGTFAAAPMPDGQAVAVTTYDRRGYRPALQPLDSLQAEPWRTVPANVVNPERPRWPVINLDTLSFTAADSLMQSEQAPARRYRKALHALHLHSWLPAAFDPFEAVDEHRVAPNVGVTLLSQNRLSNTEAFAYYGWNRDEGSLIKAGLRYDGWGVRLGVGFSYGGNQQVYSLVTSNPESDEPLRQPLPHIGKHYAVEASASLPLLFHRGYHTRRLIFSAAWSYSNGRVADLSAIERDSEGRIANIEQIGYRDGLHKLVFGVSLSDQVRMAHRDFLPRFAWQLLANWSVNPTNDDYGQLVAAYGHLYLPGVAPHHSLKLAATYQTSLGGTKFDPGYRPLSYRSTLLIPTGFASSVINSDRYRAFAADYQLPVAYPDGGISSLLYIKRIRINAGAQLAQFRVAGNRTMVDRRIWSVGGDLIVDFNLFRLPASATSTFKLSVYHPSSGGVWIGSAIGLPF